MYQLYMITPLWFVPNPQRFLCIGWHQVEALIHGNIENGSLYNKQYEPIGISEVDLFSFSFGGQPFKSFWHINNIDVLRYLNPEPIAKSLSQGLCDQKEATESVEQSKRLHESVDESQRTRFVLHRKIKRIAEADRFNNASSPQHDIANCQIDQLHEYAAEPRRRRRSKMAAAVAELIKRRPKRRRRRTSSALNRLGV